MLFEIEGGPGLDRLESRRPTAPDEVMNVQRGGENPALNSRRRATRRFAAFGQMIPELERLIPLREQGNQPDQLAGLGFGIVRQPERGQFGIGADPGQQIQFRFQVLAQRVLGDGERSPYRS